MDYSSLLSKMNIILKYKEFLVAIPLQVLIIQNFILLL